MLKDVKNNRWLKIEQRSLDGGAGLIKLPRDNKLGYTKATIVWSWGGGWEHVSVAPLNGTIPKWEDMCFIKDMFWEDTDWVVQFHPSKDEYVNNMPNCLHLWRSINQDMPTPPSILTGIK